MNVHFSRFAKQVELTYRVGYHRNFSTPQCDDDTITDKSLGYSDGGWTFHNLDSYNATNQSVGIICTAYDAQQNWAYGYNHFVITVNSNGPFYIR